MKIYGHLTIKKTERTKPKKYVIMFQHINADIKPRRAACTPHFETYDEARHYIEKYGRYALKQSYKKTNYGRKELVKAINNGDLENYFNKSKTNATLQHPNQSEMPKE